MRKMRRLAALLLTFIMMFGLATTVHAVDITIKQDEEVSTQSTYSAYKLLGAEEMNDGSEKYNFTVETKYENILKTVTGKTEHTEIIKYIEALVSDSDAINTFAGDIYNAIQSEGLEADKTSTNGKISDADQGYYLIAETILSDAADTYSLLMLNTAGKEDILVNTKEGEPTVEKFVKEVNDSTGDYSWGKSADHDVNDVIEYQIIGTVSPKYEKYESYYYSFVDTMDESLTLKTDSVKVYVGGTTETNGTYKKDGVEVTDQFDIDTTASNLIVTANLKELTDVVITGESNIYVLYQAELNEKALHGKPGNENTVYLEYENDPYHDADGDNNPKTPNKPTDPGKTPEDINIVFTFKTVVNKQDSEKQALKGAGFTLYKWDVSKTEEDKWTQVGEEIVGTTEQPITTFNFNGLDVGKYKLSETTVPKGYNRAADIIFEVEATYEINTTNNKMALTGLLVKDDAGKVISGTEGDDKQFSVTTDLDVLSTTVINKPGVTLPTTGGIGTTIFYVAGGILVVGAVVLLVTKKRMNAEK